ncbi:MAG: ABC transporter permease [Gemmatimonadaceae bacterium]
MMKFAKGDPFPSTADGVAFNKEVREYYHQQLGSNDPIVVQFGRWLGSLAHGDLGISNQPGSRKVSTIIAEALPVTLQLMSLALLTSVIAGVAIGAWQGAQRRSRAQRTSSAVITVLYSLPEFWIATVLLFLFAGVLHWFPAQGMSEAGVTFHGVRAALDRLMHFVLPWLSLTLVGTAIFARYQQAAMRDVLDEMFVRTARAKGVSESSVLGKHALRVAILPVITVGGLFFPALLTGAVLVEKIFAWPGLGRVLTDAVASRDYYVVTGVVIVGSIMTAVGSFLADILREIYDPRLRA